jgi:hypothetical protein
MNNKTSIIYDHRKHLINNYLMVTTMVLSDIYLTYKWGVVVPVVLYQFYLVFVKLVLPTL